MDAQKFGAMCFALLAACGTSLNINNDGSLSDAGSDMNIEPCRDECLENETRCSGDLVQTCQKQTSGCFNWSKASLCDKGACRAQQCTQTCIPSCPTGFTCNNSLICVGGSPDNVQIGISQVRVHGRILLNGQAPTLSQCTDAALVVSFFDPFKRHGFQTSIPCNTADFSYEVAVLPGSYQIALLNSATPAQTNLPANPYVEESPVAIGGETTLDLHVKARFPVSGQALFRNGPIPETVDCTLSGNLEKGKVIFEDVSGKNVSVQQNLLCSNTQNNFQVQLVPGTYRVRLIYSVSGVSVQQTAISNLLVDRELSSVQVNLQAARVSGSITRNGLALVDTANCNKSAIVFFENEGHERFATAALCDANSTFSTPIPYGTYKVFAAGQDSNLSKQALSVLPTLTISSDRPDLNLNVIEQEVNYGGQVQVSGATPIKLPDCVDNSTAFSIVFSSTRIPGGRKMVDLACSSQTFEFQTQLLPGTYRVEIASYHIKDGPITAVPYTNDHPLIISQNDVSNAVLNLKPSHQVSGKVQVNGAPIIPDPVCSTRFSGMLGYVSFLPEYDRDTNALGTLVHLPCSDPNQKFSLSLDEATYFTRVYGNYGPQSNIPPQSRPNGYLSLSPLTVDQDLTDLVFNVKIARLKGKLTLNGQVPLVDNAKCQQRAATVSFLNQDTVNYQNLYFRSYIPCDTTDFSYSADLIPGVYEVRATGTASTNLPGEIIVIDRILVE